MTTDALEQRLSDLALEAPDAGRVTARVLSLAVTPRRRHLARVVTLAVATLALMLAVLYFVPVADAVLADTPIAGDLLRDAGLAGAGDRVTAVGAVATSSGYRLELVGAYADSTRTVLLIHAEPGIGLSGTGPELTDQFGRTYQMHGATGNFLTGNVALQFEALGWPDGITGARITLHITTVEPALLHGLGNRGPYRHHLRHREPSRARGRCPQPSGLTREPPLLCPLPHISGRQPTGSPLSARQPQRSPSTSISRA